MSESQLGRNLATYVALTGMIGIGLGFFVLLAMVFPGLVKMIFIPIFFVFFLAFHYILWGRTLMQQKAEYDAEQAELAAMRDELDG